MASGQSSFEELIVSGWYSLRKEEHKYYSQDITVQQYYSM